MIGIAILTLAFGAIWGIGKIGFGTFLVDPAMLFISGYFITYIIYKYLTPAIKLSPIRRFFVLLFPLSLLGLSIGVWLPYFNLVDSKDVYFGLLPQWLIGPVNGNDFMWNGLGIEKLVGKIVPESLLPTYKYFWFNALAFLVWCFYLPILGWGVLEGQAAALIANPKPAKLLLEWLRILLVGLSLSLLIAALASLVVRIYLP